MKKRMLSVLLCCVLLIGLLPAAVSTASAADRDTGKAIRFGTGGIRGYNRTTGYDYIYFGNWSVPEGKTSEAAEGPIKWRVLHDYTNNGESKGFFLLSEGLLGTGEWGEMYFDKSRDPKSSAWQGSDAQAWCKDFAGEAGAKTEVPDAFTAGELAAILATEKSDGEWESKIHSVKFDMSMNILNGDKVFFLSALEAENPNYGFADGDGSLIAYYGTKVYRWWLRSPIAREDYRHHVGRISDDGIVVQINPDVPFSAVRPAFNLNKSSILFVSAADGKSTGGMGSGLTAVGDYTGSEWKLTLKDSSRSFSVTSDRAVTAKQGGSVEIAYTGARTGGNEYVSAVLVDNNNSDVILYYGRIANNSASGTASVTIPEGIALGSYTLRVFSEQYNGDKQTDYASDYQDIALTVQPAYPVRLNTNGGTINSGDVTEYTYGEGATLPTNVTREGYTFAGWYDNEALSGTPVTAIGKTDTGDKEYWAKWTINQYTITFDTDGGSSIAPITQDYGTPVTAPGDPTKTGHTFAGWDKTIPSTMPAENTTVKALWTVNQYTITFDTDGGSPIAPITQDYGTTVTAPDTPMKTGHTFAGWDQAIPSTMPAEDMTVKATWRVNWYTIAYVLNGGTNNAGNPDGYTYGVGIAKLLAPVQNDCHFLGWYENEDFSGDAVTAIAADRTEDVTLYAKWMSTVFSDPSSPSYAVSVDKAQNGSVSADRKTAGKGATVTVTVTPDKGYTLETIAVLDKDGNALPLTDKGDGRYTFTMPSGSVTVKATFMDDNTMLNFFTDVKPGDYFYDAVLWAAQKGITSGTDAVHFSPNLPCTRAQIVTFLWRAAGSPVVNYAMDMSDVPEGAYYAEAVRWALSLGVASGTTATTFSPDAVCTRAQAVAFLFRYAAPEAVTLQELVSGYADAASVPGYALPAMNWALAGGIVQGDGGSLMPNDACTRAQIVALLWRALQ